MTNAALASRTTSGLDVPHHEDHRDIGGIRVAVTRGIEAASMIDDRLDAGCFTKLAFLNAHCVNLAYLDGEYRAALADFTILPDGAGVDVASRILHGASFPENLNGTDFVPLLLTQLKRPMRVALLGSEPGIVERAAARFAMLTPHHQYLPISHGYFAEGIETDAVLAKLRAAKADIVLVALGVPRQELFIARHLSSGDATIAIAVGALLDFMAGKVPRAPSIVRRLRLEWVFRLALEPKRLWRRYLLGNATFLLHILREKRRRAASHGGY